MILGRFSSDTTIHLADEHELVTEYESPDRALPCFAELEVKEILRHVPVPVMPIEPQRPTSTSHRLAVQTACLSTRAPFTLGRSGSLPRYRVAGVPDLSSVRAGLRVFEADPLIFAPDERFAYSSFGFNVAGAVFEAIAGRPFLDALEAAVLRALGVQQTGGDFADRELADRVRDRQG